MTAIPEYKHLKVNRAEGIIEAIVHSDDGPLVWSAAAMREMTDFFGWVGNDEDTKVLILTGTGKDYCAKLDPTEFMAMKWREIWSTEQQMLNRLMNLNTIVIAAVNGPIAIHSEMPVMADIVIACPEAEFSDRYHFKQNVVPGDGAQLVWGSVLGSSRTNYFFLTGERIAADEAKRLGAVHEIHPREALLERARDLARGLTKRHSATLSYTKAALRLRDRRFFSQDLSHGLSLKGLAMHAAGFRGSE
jgi:enoyl-CoA hydratase/carnithine racemase